VDKELESGRRGSRGEGEMVSCTDWNIPGMYRWITAVLTDSCIPVQELEGRLYKGEYESPTQVNTADPEQIEQVGGCPPQEHVQQREHIPPQQHWKRDFDNAAACLTLYLHVAQY
jgi:hypothetical protein